MPIRFSFNGVEYSVDTPHEAAELQTVLSRKKSATKAAATRWSLKPQPVDRRPVNKVMQAFYEAGKGIDSDGLAKVLGVKTTAIPPLFGHARAWVRDVAPDMDFDQLVLKIEHPEGGYIYRMTKEGRDLIERLQLPQEE